MTMNDAPYLMILAGCALYTLSIHMSFSAFAIMRRRLSAALLITTGLKARIAFWKSIALAQEKKLSRSHQPRGDGGRFVGK